MPRTRANGEGSIFPYRNGYAAYIWVTTPSGNRSRKWVYGRTREVVHEKWVKLQARAEAAPVPTSTPTLAQYLTRWLQDPAFQRPSAHMPALELSDADIRALAAYLSSRR